MTLLTLRGICKSFSGLHVLRDVALDVEAQGVFGIIGANGAGKTTLFNIVSGALKPDAGEVTFAGSPVTNLTPSRLCALGIARTFQVAKPFPRLSVIETIRVAILGRVHDMTEATRRAEIIARRFGLGDKADRLGQSLSVLERKRLELARAYATAPCLLLLDEVAAGLRPTEVEDLVALVRSITQEGITVLMIEHVLTAVFALAQQVAVLDQGKIIAQGTPAEVANDRSVIEAYLGSGYAAA